MKNVCVCMYNYTFLVLSVISVETRIMVIHSYVCMYVCMYVYIYIYIYIYIYSTL